MVCRTFLGKFWMYTMLIRQIGTIGHISQSNQPPGSNWKNFEKWHEYVWFNAISRCAELNNGIKYLGRSIQISRHVAVNGNEEAAKLARHGAER